MGKTRDFFKKITDTKGKFHAKMDSIKDRNSMDLTECKYNVNISYQCVANSSCKNIFFFYYIFILFYFTILYWFCHTLT